MNIKSVNSNFAINNYTKSVNNIKTQKPVEKADKVEISSIGKHLSSISKNADKDVNIDKVNKIKSMIENGTYNIDSKELAKKILEKTKG
jgi:negative regulator of flagellin synthesis FlgM